jgi:hypothetical protein
MSSEQESITRLLQEWSFRNKAAIDRLVRGQLTYCSNSGR